MIAVFRMQGRTPHVRHRERLLAAGLLSIAASAGAEIRYIPLEEAESTRKCLLWSTKLEKAEDELRLATVAGGSALGKTTVETNAIRTKLKFERDYFKRKAESACAEEAAVKAAAGQADEAPGGCEGCDGKAAPETGRNAGDSPVDPAAD